MTDLRLESREKETLALNVFEKNQNNILKSIQYLEEYSVSDEWKIKFLSYSSDLFTLICSLVNFIHIVNKKITLFSDIKLTAVKVIIATANYFNGNFGKSYKSLKELLPLVEMKKLNPNIPVELITLQSARSIYAMEGNQACVYSTIYNNSHDFKYALDIDLGIFEQCTKNMQDIYIGLAYFEFQYL